MRSSPRRLCKRPQPARLEPSRASYRCFTLVATIIFRGDKSVGDWRGALDASFLDHHTSKKNAAWPLRTPRHRFLDPWEACRRLSPLSASQKTEKTGSFASAEALISACSVSLVRLSPHLCWSSQRSQQWPATTVPHRTSRVRSPAPPRSALWTPTCLSLGS